MDGGKTRKPRLKNADESENRLFLDILKTANDGSMWKIITQGTSKRQDSHDVWVTAARIFSRETGTEITWQQAKSKWLRMKQNAKKKADKAHTDREFRKLCQKTGGGPAPSQPPLEDADDDNGFDLDVLHETEPMETPFNELVQPQDRMTSRAGGSVPSSSCTTSYQTPRHSTPQSQTTKTFPYAARQPTPSSCPSQIPRRFSQGTAPPSSSLPGIVARGSLLETASLSLLSSTTTRQNPPGGSIENESDDGQDFHEGDNDLPDLNENVSSFERRLDDDQVLLIDGNGQRRLVEKAVPETPKTAPKKSKKKNVNDEGANYYSRMLEIQENLLKERVEVFKLKKCWLKQKIENEKLQKIWLQKKIVNEDGHSGHEELHKEDREEVSDSDTSGEDFEDIER